MAKLSICVPSRNRQIWFQETIRALLESPREDVEFVFADNSDDASIMAEFMRAHAKDPRVTFLSPGPVVYSMVDNWERTVAASSGDWVTVIGDDDYVDPDLASVLRKVELMLPDVEAFGWSYASFTWPGSGEAAPDTNIALDLTHHFIEIPREWLIRRAYLWVDATTTPTHGFSIYHSALSRRLVERIRQRFNGRYFEHPTVDFDSSFKSVLLGKRFLMWQRPLSIHGVCPLSISSIIFDAKRIPSANANFFAELGRDFFEDATMAGLPFDSNMGVPASILATQQWVKHSAGFSIDGWQENFARCCANYCARFRSREDFDVIAGLYRSSFARWEGGRYAHAFDPVYTEMPASYAAFSGIRDGKIYLSNRNTGARTPQEIYEVMSALAPPLEDIVIDPTMLRRPADAPVAEPVPA
ncbi:glycosyltransferase family 2 protein [Rhizobium sp. C4]|uniref:glycosyltransferase family 2 protein n=1 Tax=Rhizobium sp. C4 TaxID=1349800 RepID=UPI001E47D5A1|nr:glycosyltransferase family 2 protein [Rhizobium sp. C4]MCD2176193.1 glycosyltransferase family 2 protein [Rhizobium sp. C4]